MDSDPLIYGALVSVSGLDPGHFPFSPTIDFVEGGSGSGMLEYARDATVGDAAGSVMVMMVVEATVVVIELEVLSLTGMALPSFRFQEVGGALLASCFLVTPV